MSSKEQKREDCALQWQLFIFLFLFSFKYAKLKKWSSVIFFGDLGLQMSCASLAYATLSSPSLSRAHRIFFGSFCWRWHHKRKRLSCWFTTMHGSSTCWLLPRRDAAKIVCVCVRAADRQAILCWKTNLSLEQPAVFRVTNRDPSRRPHARQTDRQTDRPKTNIDKRGGGWWGPKTWAAGCVK